jgi:uncharacterized membrane protein YkvA (DUF1232 family)
MSEPNVVIELNPRERRLWDRVRAVVVDPRVPLGSKAVALVAVGYVLSPVDLLPEIVLGPIGLVDDLLVVSLALSRLLNDVHPDVVRSHWSGKGDALEAVQNAIDWSQGLFRERFGAPLRRFFGF